MVKMKLYITAEEFFRHRVEMAKWLSLQKISFEIHCKPVKGKVQFLFERTHDAWNFQVAFEDL